jgi:SNF2 family DNA or RNA helicase
MICGDQMGLGKTLLAIMAIDLAKDDPGSFSLVVCPLSCASQWVADITNNFLPVCAPISSSFYH